MNAKWDPAGVRKMMQLIFRTILPVFVGMGVLIAIIAWLSGAFTEKTEPGRYDRPTVDVSKLRTEVVQPLAKEHVKEALGTLKAASRTVIASRLLAVIEELNVTAGDRVEAGQVLVRLQDLELRTRVQQAEQALAAAAGYPCRTLSWGPARARSTRTANC